RSAALATQHQLAPPNEVIGLVDDPANCSQYPLTLGPKSARDDVAVLSNSVAWVGTADSGVETTLATVCQHVQQRPERKFFLDGGRLMCSENSWDTYLHVSDAAPDALHEMVQHLTVLLTEEQHTTVVKI